MARVVVLGVSVIGAALFPAHAGGAQPEQIPPPGTSAEVVAAWPETLAAAQRAHPDATEEQVWRSWLSAGDQLGFMEALAADHVAGIVGSDVDPTTDVLTVIVGPDADRAAVEALAAERGIAVAFREVPNTEGAVNALRDELVARFDPYGANPYSIHSIVSAPDEGTVLVGVFSQAIADALPADVRSDDRVRVTLLDQAQADAVEWTACTSRTSCGTPARSGVVIGIDADGSGPGVAGQSL